MIQEALINFPLPGVAKARKSGSPAAHIAIGSKASWSRSNAILDKFKPLSVCSKPSAIMTL